MTEAEYAARIRPLVKEALDLTEDVRQSDLRPRLVTTAADRIENLTDLVGELDPPTPGLHSLQEQAIQGMNLISMGLFQQAIADTSVPGDLADEAKPKLEEGEMRARAALQRLRAMQGER